MGAKQNPRLGRYVVKTYNQETVRAYVPPPLPPNPPVHMETLQLLAEEAAIAAQRLGILREITGRQRHRLSVYDAYLAILNEGTEPFQQAALRYSPCGQQAKWKLW